MKVLLSIVSPLQAEGSGVGLITVQVEKSFLKN